MKANKYETSYRQLNTYISTMEKMLGKEQSPLIKECKANLYDLVKKEERIMATNLIMTDGGWYCKCPRCSQEVSIRNSRCSNCGQKIMKGGVD